MKASDLMRSCAERLLEVSKFGRNLHHGPRFAHSLEIGARRLAGAGAVVIPFVKNQPRRRHQIEHGGDYAVIKPRRRNFAILWKAVVILRPQPMNDKGIGSRAALYVAGAPLGSPSAEGWRPGQGQNVKIEVSPVHSAWDPALSPLGG